MSETALIAIKKQYTSSAYLPLVSGRVRVLLRQGHPVPSTSTPERLVNSAGRTNSFSASPTLRPSRTETERKLQTKCAWCCCGTMTWILTVVVSSLVALAKAAPPGGYYATKYDHLNVDTILNTRRLVNYYADCLTNKGPCTPQGAEFKRKWWFILSMSVGAFSRFSLVHF